MSTLRLHSIRKKPIYDTNQYSNKLYLIFTADAYYHLGEFEKSLMFFYRALHKCQIGSEGEEIR